MRPKGFADYPHFLEACKTREKLLSKDLLVDEFIGGAARNFLISCKSPLTNAFAVMGILTFETYLAQVAGLPKVIDLTMGPPSILSAQIAIPMRANDD